MKLSFMTDSLGYLKYEEMLDVISGMGVKAIEIATGNWSKAPHIDLEQMLASKLERERFMEALNKRDMTLHALNCSGNPLAPGRSGKAHLDVTLKTIKLAELLNVNKIVMMSGLPGGCKDDKSSVWVVTSWPPETQNMLDYQWNEVAIPFWKDLAGTAKDSGIERIALENHGWQLVYNVETINRLQNHVGEIVGMNLDPGHAFWMGADPIAMARALKGKIYHIHGKDARLEKGLLDINTVLDTKTIERFSERSWNYVAVGYGHDHQWWKEFLSIVKMSGYDDYVSLEMEDLTMTPMAGVKASINVLKECICT
ncbi:MAG: sugar phosphate isomerase/epimerase [Bacillota bacterium]|nr:sugar phosphate isomerase/epimerase [Bacillota bacterium]